MNVQPSTVAAIETAPNFAVLLAEYAAESAIAGMPPPNARMDAYRDLEAKGLLSVLAALSDDGELIGFISVLAAPLPHYGMSVAVSESFFVAKAHRSTGAGLRLLRDAEVKAREIGSPGLLVSAPFAGKLFELLPRLGYAETSRIFFKRLADA